MKKLAAGCSNDPIPIPADACFGPILSTEVSPEALAKMATKGLAISTGAVHSASRWLSGAEMAAATKPIRENIRAAADAESLRLFGVTVRAEWPDGLLDEPFPR